MAAYGARAVNKCSGDEVDRARPYKPGRDHEDEGHD